MGSHYQTIVDLDATPEEAEALGARVAAWLVEEGIAVAGEGFSHHDQSVLTPGPRWSCVTDERRRLSTDGLAIVTGRTVFFGSMSTGGSPVCPRCAEVASGEGERSSFSEAMDTWYATGEAAVRCPACRRTVSLPAWEWENDCFAFAYLGVEHWNGPPLRPEFVSGVARVLGHRTRLLVGKT
ncbi:hypothetical protein ACFQ7A_02145 [Streptomyces sp. NPDC056528]|uniref:hypothetical protein n=1 Tax=Streptomyces sp. NPDC056528 TaxID=3345854 RepID=UPI00367C157E